MDNEKNKKEYLNFYALMSDLNAMHGVNMTTQDIFRMLMVDDLQGEEIKEELKEEGKL